MHFALKLKKKTKLRVSLNPVAISRTPLLQQYLKNVTVLSFTLCVVVAFQLSIPDC